MNIWIRMLVVASLFAVSGCGPESPPTAGSTPAVTRGADAGTGELDPLIASAILANPRRTAEGRERDARSKPEVVLGLLALEPGQRVADLLGGSGYYTDLMAAIVGADGEVILYNNTPYHGFAKKQVQPRYIDNPVPGITYLQSELDDLQLEPESLDAALMVMSYHDLYYFDPGRGFSRTDVPKFFAQVHAALKPGGRLVIVDHSAKAGTGSAAAQHLHRIDEAFAIQDIESNGFRLVATSDALRNPDDNRQKLVFDSEFRGKTDRFILLFEKVPG